MAMAQTVGSMSPGLLKVAERAKRDPEVRFNSLAHLIDEAALKRAFARIRKDAATGVDGVTKGCYGAMLDENVRYVFTPPPLVRHPAGRPCQS